MNEFGERLKFLREQKSLLQSDLADELKVNRSLIGHWEKGRNLPEVKKLCEIADYFGVSTDYLLGREE